MDSKIQSSLLEILKSRFQKNMHRHLEIKWEEVESKLNSSSEKILILQKMEETGGEPDVVVFENSKELFFIDCSKESPKGRRSLCYDEQALESRKKFKPKNSAIKLASQIGIQILDENQYLNLQKLEDLDLVTSSWILTPSKIRKEGGSIFGDKRYKRTFIYHNGAESYYGSRGFRGFLRI